MKNQKSMAIVRFFFPQVENVIDSLKGALIEVTLSDASHGDVKNHKTCALAIACKRFFHADGVIIGFVHDPADIIEYAGANGVGRFGHIKLDPKFKLAPGTPVTITVKAAAPAAKH